MGCYYRVVAFEFLGCDRAFCLFVLSPHYDQTAIGYKFIQGNIVLEIFSPRSFDHLRKSLRQHQDSRACVEKIRVNFGRVPATLEIMRGRVFKTSDQVQLTVIFICLIAISSTQFCLVKCSETTNFEVFVAQHHKLQFIADSRRDEEVYCWNCFWGIENYCIC